MHRPVGIDGTSLPVRLSRSPANICSMVTEQPGISDAQIAADTFLIDHFKTALSINQTGIAWCEVSSQAMWQRPHLMQLS